MRDPNLSVTWLSVIRRMLKDGRGAAAVELALISPVLLLILGGTVNYGFFFLTSHSVQQLTNEAARRAVAGVTSQERMALAQSVLQDERRGGILLAGELQLEIEETQDLMTVRVRFVPENEGGFNLMGRLPGMPETIEQTLSIARGGY